MPDEATRGAGRSSYLPQKCSPSIPTYRNLFMASTNGPSGNCRAPYPRPTPPPPECPVSASWISSVIPQALQASLKECLKLWNTLRLSVSLGTLRQYRPHHWDHAGVHLPWPLRRSSGNKRSCP